MKLYVWYTNKSIKKTLGHEKCEIFASNVELSSCDYDVYAYTTDIPSYKMFKYMRSSKMFTLVKYNVTDGEYKNFKNLNPNKELMILEFRSNGGTIPVLGPKTELDSVMNIEYSGYIQSRLDMIYHNIIGFPLKDTWIETFNEINSLLFQKEDKWSTIIIPCNGIIDQFVVFCDMFGKTLNMNKIIKGD